MANLQHVKMEPFARLHRKGKTKGLIPPPQSWQGCVRPKRISRGSRRGMGYRGWRRFHVDRVLEPVDTGNAKATFHEQPQSTIRQRATKVVDKAKTFFSKLIGR